MEITSGAYAGYVIDVVTNSVWDLTLPADQIPAALVGQTVTIALRTHFTLDQLASGSFGLQATTDSVTLHNGDGSTSQRFFNGASWVAEDMSSPAGQTVIYPGNGVLLTTANGASLTFLGTVKTTPTAIPLYSGVTNLVGPLNPTASLPLVSLNLAPALTTATDNFGTYSVDGSLTLLGTFYSDGTNLLSSPTGPALPAGDTTDVLLGNTGIELNLSTTTFWICPQVISQ